MHRNAVRPACNLGEKSGNRRSKMKKQKTRSWSHLLHGDCIKNRKKLQLLQKNTTCNFLSAQILKKWKIFRGNIRELEIL
jgi:hypothetical protein